MIPHKGSKTPVTVDIGYDGRFWFVDVYHYDSMFGMQDKTDELCKLFQTYEEAKGYEAEMRQKYHLH